MNLNEVHLIGRITRDIELRKFPNGSSVAIFGLAINRNWKSKDGKKKEETTFVDCEAFGKQAEVLNQYASKGSPLYVGGRLKLDSWQDREGQKRSKLKVVVENFQFLKSKTESPGDRRDPALSQPGLYDDKQGQPEISEEIIPF